MPLVDSSSSFIRRRTDQLDESADCVETLTNTRYFISFASNNLLCYLLRIGGRDYDEFWILGDGVHVAFHFDNLVSFIFVRNL